MVRERFGRLYTVDWEIVSNKLKKGALGGPDLAFLFTYALMTLDRLQTAVPSHPQASRAHTKARTLGSARCSCPYY